MNIFGASTSNQQAVDADYMQNYKYIHGKLNIYPYTEDVCNMYNKQRIPQQIHMLLQHLTMDIILVHAYICYHRNLYTISSTDFIFKTDFRDINIVVQNRDEYVSLTIIFSKLIL